MFVCYVSIISQYNVFLRIQFRSQMTFFRFFRTSFLERHFFTYDEFFLQVFFDNFLTILTSFKSFINKFVTCIFILMFWYRRTKCVTNPNQFMSLTRSNMILIIISVLFVRIATINFRKLSNCIQNHHKLQKELSTVYNVQ